MKKTVKKYWDNNHQLVLLGCTAFLYIAGVVQYAFGLTYVLPLTPVMLALVAAICLLIWDAPVKRKILLSLGIVLAGFAVEQIGVHTGFLFGNYSYGSTLGFKAWGVPVTIGITWLIVTLSAWHIVAFGKLSRLYSFLLAGVLVVMFDLVLEQFAVSYGLWTWWSAIIPFSNYVTWFVVAQVFFLAYYKLSKQDEPSIYIAAQLPLMALFFWLMLLVH